MLLKRSITLLILLFSLPCYAINWTQNWYEDKRWQTSSAPFGYGYSRVETPVTYGHSAYYFRQSFYIDGFEENYDSIILNIACDDGFVAYINGVEIARSNMPLGTVAHHSKALSPHQANSCQSFDIDLDEMIRLFEYSYQYTLNLSIEIHQEAESIDDIYFDAELVTTGNYSGNLIEKNSQWKFWQENKSPYQIYSDPITTIQYPLLNLPAIRLQGDTLTITCFSSPDVHNWDASIQNQFFTFDLPIQSTHFQTSTNRWFLQTQIPQNVPEELYDLVVISDITIPDTTQHSIKILKDFKEDYSFVHLTDTHLPERGNWPPQTIPDFLNVIEHVNLINPAFVLITGDLFHRAIADEAEIAQQLLTKFTCPVFVVAGNHDIGGGPTYWWDYFGWQNLWSQSPYNTGFYTQDYKFDYGNDHYLGLMTWQNYVWFDYYIYGWESLIRSQENWLRSNLSKCSENDFTCLFYHYDFSDPQIANIGDYYDVNLHLWGHTHQNEEYYLSTGLSLNTAPSYGSDGCYRLINMSDGKIDEHHLMFHNQNNITVDYSPENNGSNDVILATITNNYPVNFNNIMLKLIVPDGIDYKVSNGEIKQVVNINNSKIYYVEISILQNSAKTITIMPQNQEFSTDPSLYTPSPNPFSNSVKIPYFLPTKGYMSLSVYNVYGHLIKTLYKAQQDFGINDIVWDGNDQDGKPIPMGTYFVKLEFENYELIEKVIFVK